MTRLALLFWLLVAPVWAQSTTEALVQSLVASPRAGWPGLIAAHQGPVDPAALKPLMQQALGLPLAQAGLTMEAIDAVAAKAAGTYQGKAQQILARKLIKTNDLPAALEYTTALTTAHPELTEAQAMRGFCLNETGRYAEAHAVFTALTRAAPMFEIAWTELGRACVLMNRREEALAAYQQALAVNPESSVARNAVASLTGAAPLRLKANPQARAHFEKAEGLFRERKFPEAIAEYQLSAQADPKFAKPLVYIGDAWLQLGEPEKAVASYQQALVVDPQDKQAHRSLGELYESRFDKTGEASWLDQALASYKAALPYPGVQEALQRAEAKRR